MEEVKKNEAAAAPQAPVKRSNGMAVTGFVLALLGLIFSWVPVLGWILWVLGLIFSIIGVCKAPRGLAIAGLVITFIGLIALIVLASALSAAALAF